MKYILYLLYLICQFDSMVLIAYDVKSPNIRDSLGLKIGEWTETDTLPYKEVLIPHTYSMTTNGCISSVGAPVTSLMNFIIYSKGNYSDGLKNGTWKYYLGVDKLYKQVTYRRGIIQKVEIDYNNGKWKFEAVVNFAKKIAHFKTYDKSGNVETEGDFPLSFLYSNSLYYTF